MALALISHQLLKRMAAAQQLWSQALRVKFLKLINIKGKSLQGVLSHLSSLIFCLCTQHISMTASCGFIIPVSRTTDGNRIEIRVPFKKKKKSHKKHSCLQILSTRSEKAYPPFEKNTQTNKKPNQRKPT